MSPTGQPVVRDHFGPEVAPGAICLSTGTLTAAMHAGRRAGTAYRTYRGEVPKKVGEKG